MVQEKEFFCCTFGLNFVQSQALQADLFILKTLIQVFFSSFHYLQQKLGATLLYENKTNFTVG